MTYIYISHDASMYGIFTYIYHEKMYKIQPNVGKYISPMDGMGMETLVFFL